MAIYEKTIDVEGLPVRYFEGGEDHTRTLLLLHGGFGNAQTNWCSVLPTLSEEFHVFAPDLPGFGGSSPLPQTTFDHLIHWIGALLDALAQPEVVIVGSSIGGLLARLFAAAQPHYVSALILVNGGTIPRFPKLLPILVGTPFLGTAIFEIFGRIFFSRNSVEKLIYVKDVMTEDLVKSWRSNLRGFASLTRAMMVYTYPAVATPSMPTLLLWGANDTLVTMRDAERLKKIIPDALLAPITECGHVPALEAGEVFTFQISAFFDRLSRKTLPSLQGAGILHSNQA